MRTVPIKDYEKSYTINELGEVYSNLSNRYLKGYILNGYKSIGLSNNGKCKHYFLHRLLYQAFKGDLIEGLVIDHIDNNTLNNALDNLQQTTQRHNCSKDQFRQERTSKHIGVYKEVNRKGFRAEITYGKKQFVIGSFDNEQDASNAYKDVLSDFNNINKYKSIITKSSPYKGVYFDKQRNNYRAEITINKTRHRIGRYPTPEAALQAIKQYCTTKDIPYTY